MAEVAAGFAGGILAVAGLLILVHYLNKGGWA